MSKKYYLLYFMCFYRIAFCYHFTHEPIDVVIPCHKKDQATLHYAIDGVKKNVQNLGRIIVVSESKLSENAEWFDERQFPFTKKSIAYEIFKQNKKRAEEFLNSPKTRIGWIFQQFLKFYSIFVIPNISSNILILDADTVFLRPVSFQDETGAGLYCPSNENTEAYFKHLAKVFPGFRKVFPQYSGISHHMLMQRSVMEEIYGIIKSTRGEAWKVFCAAIDMKELYKSCMCIEYELYFNHVFANSDQVKIRHLKWDNVVDLDFEKYRKQGYDFVSAHAWMRIKQDKK